MQHIANCTLTNYAAHWLLRDVAALAHRLYSPADTSSFVSRVQLGDLLVTATTAHHSTPSLPPLLLAALDAVLYAGRPELSAAAVSAALSVIHTATSAVWASASACGPTPVLRLRPSWPLQMSRVPPAGPPSAVSVGAVDVLFPTSLGSILSAQATVTDLTVGTFPAPRGALVDVVHVTFTDAGSGAELVMSQLPEPLSIVWLVQNGSALLQPVLDFYQCVYEVCASAEPITRPIAR